ncbi:MAG: DUF3244 domain-containing protein [Saprospiraceae bacterium]|nr:DUF3244 domain-containing protein [Saprospiraceae bacterium]
MKKLFSAAAILVAFAIITPLNAQLLSISTPNGNDSSKLSSSIKEWSFYTDNENRIVYIDFEKIDVNLSSVTVKDKDSQIVFRDENLWQLPVNTIYEVDFSSKPKGQYSIELRTFTATLKKTITIN